MSRNRWQIPYKSKTPEYMRCRYLCLRAGGRPWPELTAEDKKHRPWSCSGTKSDGSLMFPKSAQAILGALENGKLLDRAGLVAETGMNPRTVWYGLRKLKEQNKIIEKFNWKDARKKLYQKAKP